MRFLQWKTFASTISRVIAVKENYVISTMMIRNVKLKAVIIESVVIDIPYHADTSNLERTICLGTLVILITMVM